MKTHNYNKECGAITPMTSKDAHCKRMHPCADKDHRGRLISDYGPGGAVRRRISNKLASSIHHQGWVDGLHTVGTIIGKYAMDGLAGSCLRGERGLVALLHACKGACIEMQDYEMAQQFQDMANNRQG